MKHLCAVAGWVVVLLIVAQAAPDGRGPVSAEAPREALEEYLNRATVFGFSGAVLAAKNGKIILQKGYGLADRQRSLPITADTPFYLASLSKQFTAAAILKLEMQGKLRTTDSLAKYLDSVPEDKARLTLHHLLTHTAGLGGRVGDAEKRLTRDEMVREILATKLISAPGEKYFYSNPGYNLLAAVVERVSGQPFAQYLDEHLFRPAGMTRTGLITEPAKWPPSLRARSYNGSLDQGDVLISHHLPYSWTEFGATGVVSTVADLYRWDRALRTERILSAEAQRRFYTPALENYACGWVVSRTPQGTTLVQHDGLLLQEGWNTQYRRYLEDDAVVIVLSNSYRDEALSAPVSRDVGRLLFGQEVALPPAVAETTPDMLAHHAGEYELASGARLRVTARSGQLWVEGLNQEGVNLLLDPASENVKRFKDLNERAALLIGALGRGDLAAVRNLLDSSRSFEEWESRLDGTWRWLVDRFGRFERFSVLPSVADDAEGKLVRTFVRLRFARRPTTIRLIWSEGQLAGMSDSGAFLSRSQEMPVWPGEMPLASQPDAGFLSYNLVTRKGVRLRFAAGRLTIAPYLPPPLSTVQGNVIFRLKNFGSARAVALAGDFNDWDPQRHLCVRQGDEWVCRLDLAPGRYLYKFVVDGQWMIDPENGLREDDGAGNVNSVRVVPTK